jgi:hypothetical protein
MSGVTVSNTKLDNVRADGDEALPRMGSPEALYLVLDTLIEIDISYELEREKLFKSAPDDHVRARLLRKLKERHGAQRQPFIQQLMVLETGDWA